MSQNFTCRIGSFTGLRYSSDHTEELGNGDAAELYNFKITAGGKLARRDGFRSLFSSEEPLRGIWYGTVCGKERFLAVRGERFLSSETGFDSLEESETKVPGADKVIFFLFHSELYLLTGEGILKYDGERLFYEEPYVPLIMISTPPAGNGVLYEDVNLLTKKVRQRFSPDGESLLFRPAHKVIRRVDWIRLDGIDLPETQVAYDGVKGGFLFHMPPDAGIDTVEVQYEIYGEDVSSRIKNCRYAAAFGGASDTRAFLYGNSETPAIRYHSGVVEGRPAFHYFPETAFALVGTGEPITAILRHYDRQLIFTKSAAYYSYLEYMTGSEGRVIAAFPVLPMNEERGCAAPGQACLVRNTPYTVAEDGIFRWVSTNIRDERNAECVSEHIDTALRGRSLSEAILFNRKEESELYVCLGRDCYVLNYRLGLFYRYVLPEIRGFCQGPELYFYTSSEIFEVGGDSDNGEPITAYWRSRLLDFSQKEKEKKLFSVAVFGKGDDGKGQLELRLRGTGEGECMTKRVSFASTADPEKQLLRFPKRRFRALEAELIATGEARVKIYGIHMKGRITDAE